MNTYLVTSLIMSLFFTLGYYDAYKKDRLPPSPLDPKTTYGWVTLYVFFAVLWPACLYYFFNEGDI